MRAMSNENFVFKYGMAEPYPILYKYNKTSENFGKTKWIK